MADLCLLADVKTWLGITDDLSDPLFERLISAVSADFLNEIGRPELTPAADYTETIFRRDDLRAANDGFDLYRAARKEIYLRRYPVNSIASVTVNDNVIPEVVDPTTDSGWWFDPTRNPEDRQKVYLIGHWYPVFAIPWTWMPNIIVEYNGGYDPIDEPEDEPVPTPITQAVIEWVAFRRATGQMQGLDQTSGGVKLGDYDNQTPVSVLTSKILAMPLPDSVQRVIDQYRRPVI
jgi:hypothetical protein